MVALVTGCRSGFGLLIAQTLGRAGHTVYAGLRDPSTADGLREACAGLDVFPVALDVTSEEDRLAVVERILAEHGRIDALINNAGIGLGGFVELLERDELQRVMEVNFFGLWELMRRVIPGMRERGDGVIMNVTSMAGRMANPGLGAYSASKFAVEGMTESLRHELRPFGVRVVLVEPGPFKTDIFTRNRNEARHLAEEHPYSSQQASLQDLVDNKARLGDPQDIAELVLTLMTKKNPRLRYALGPTTGLRLGLQKWLPWGLQEAVYKKVLGF